MTTRVVSFIRLNASEKIRKRQVSCAFVVGTYSHFSLVLLVCAVWCCVVFKCCTYLSCINKLYLYHSYFELQSLAANTSVILFAVAPS